MARKRGKEEEGAPSPPQSPIRDMEVPPQMEAGALSIPQSPNPDNELPARRSSRLRKPTTSYSAEGCDQYDVVKVNGVPHKKYKEGKGKARNSQHNGLQKPLSVGEVEAIQADFLRGILNSTIQFKVLHPLKDNLVSVCSFPICVIWNPRLVQLMYRHVPSDYPGMSVRTFPSGNMLVTFTCLKSLLFGQCMPPEATEVWSKEPNEGDRHQPKAVVACDLDHFFCIRFTNKYRNEIQGNPSVDAYQGRECSNPPASGCHTTKSAKQPRTTPKQGRTRKQAPIAAARLPKPKKAKKLWEVKNMNYKDYNSARTADILAATGGQSARRFTRSGQCREEPIVNPPEAPPPSVPRSGRLGA